MYTISCFSAIDGAVPFFIYVFVCMYYISPSVKNDSKLLPGFIIPRRLINNNPIIIMCLLYTRIQFKTN